jgi:putative hydrolase of the HAD superfamily
VVLRAVGVADAYGRGEEPVMDYVFFDFDDTIYDQSGPFARAYEAVLGDRVKVDPTELFVASRRHSDELFHASERGEVTMDDMYVYRIQAAFKDLGHDVDAASCLTMQHTYAHLQETDIEVAPEMRELLDWCRTRARVGIISNGPAEHQLKKLETIGIYEWMDRSDVFISSIEGVAKPDPALYELACARTHTTPGRCVYVGDAYYPDVVGAVACGMPVVWFNHRHRAQPAGPAPDAEVYTVAEIPAAVEAVARDA